MQSFAVCEYIGRFCTCFSDKLGKVKWHLSVFSQAWGLLCLMVSLGLFSYTFFPEHIFSSLCFHISGFCSKSCIFSCYLEICSTGTAHHTTTPFRFEAFGQIAVISKQFATSVFCVAFFSPPFVVLWCFAATWSICMANGTGNNVNNKKRSVKKSYWAILLFGLLLKWREQPLERHLEKFTWW